MATIVISDLHPTGYALFSDQETFLNDLSNEQANLTYGGLVYPTTTVRYLTTSIHYPTNITSTPECASPP